MGERLRVVGLTPGPTVPSSRFRVGQYVAPLGDRGIDLDWRPARVSAYPPAAGWRRPIWLPATLAGRLPDLAAARSADVTLLNRELVSTLATLEGWAGRPLVFDVDDAVFLRRGGGFAARIARRADLVLAGNAFLADWFSAHAPGVEILPTAVDTDRFSPGAGVDRPGPVVGWSGTSGNFPSLAAVLPGVRDAMAAEPRLRFSVSADRRPDLPGLDPARVTFVRWTAAGEVDFIRSLDVGLMPLPDTDWSRGKCAYKMLLYLACGVPAVSSPVGVNAELLATAEVGLAATAAPEWKDAIGALAADPDARRKMGRAGRDLVERAFSLRALAPRLAEILRTVATGWGP